MVEHFLGKPRAEVASGFLPSLHMEDFSYMTGDHPPAWIDPREALALAVAYGDDKTPGA